MINKSILILGGNGFIGKNISNALIDEGVHHGIYDIKNEAESEYVETYTGDLLSDSKTEEVFSKYDTIIYLISSVSPATSMNCPEKAYSSDIDTLIRVLELCLKTGVKRVIFSSSGGTIYGEYKGRPALETDVTVPINHYAIIKETSEKILLLYNRLYGMENIVLRVSNPFGPGQKISSGVGAITAFAKKIIQDEEITIFGDGTNQRDYVAISDVAKAFLMAADFEYDADILPVFNIGSGVGISLNEIVDIISKNVGNTPKIKHVEQRNVDVKKSILCIDKAVKILGYSVSDVNTKIYEYIDYLCEQIGKINDI